MYLHCCRCFQYDLRMLLYHLGGYWLAAEGVWVNHKLVRITNMAHCSIWDICSGIWTVLHLVDTLASPTTLDYSLQVYLQTQLIITSNFLWSGPPYVSVISFDHSFHVDLQTCSIAVSKFTWSWHPRVLAILLGYCLPVYLQSYSIAISKCIFKFTRSQPSNDSKLRPSFDCTWIQSAASTYIWCRK